MIQNEEIWNRTTWENKTIEFIFGSRIVEYDMKSAGFNISKQFKLLPESTIQMLEGMKKDARNKKMGLIQRKDKEYSKNLLEGFRKCRKWFFVKNEIEEHQVLCTKKDAIFLIDTYPEYLETGYIRFDAKNTYSSYFKLNKLEFYLNPKLSICDIKGLGQGDSLNEVRNLHGEYILKFIMEFTRLRERLVDRQLMVSWLTTFIRNYRNRNVEIGYYRELSKSNGYKLWSEEMNDFITVNDTDDIENVNISYNYENYILPLANLYV